MKKKKILLRTVEKILVWWKNIKTTTDHDRSSTVYDRQSPWSELSSQNMQILQILSQKCQIFKVLRIRPQGQRPNSKPFKWQLMDYFFRNFNSYDYTWYILHTTDTKLGKWSASSVKIHFHISDFDTYCTRH